MSKSSWCQQQQKNINNDQYNYNILNENEDDCVIPPIFNDDNTNDDDEIVFPPNCDPSLLQQAMDHEKNQAHQTDNIYKAGIDLLNLLKLAKAPLYLFDEIIKWIKRSIYQYDIDFRHVKGLSRNVILQKAKKI